MPYTMATWVVRKVVRDVPGREGRRARTSGGRLRTAPPGSRPWIARPPSSRSPEGLAVPVRPDRDRGTPSDRIERSRLCTRAGVRRTAAGRTSPGSSSTWLPTDAASRQTATVPTTRPTRPTSARPPQRHHHRHPIAQPATDPHHRDLARLRPATPVSRTPWYRLDTPPSPGACQPSRSCFAPCRPLATGGLGQGCLEPADLGFHHQVCSNSTRPSMRPNKRNMRDSLRPLREREGERPRALTRGRSSVSATTHRRTCASHRPWPSASGRTCAASAPLPCFSREHPCPARSGSHKRRSQ